jgi:hypothetical protein
LWRKKKRRRRRRRRRKRPGNRQRLNPDVPRREGSEVRHPSKCERPLVIIVIMAWNTQNSRRMSQSIPPTLGRSAMTGPI